jgi:lactate permease
MWQQDYLPIADSLGWSALAAAIPIFVLLLLIGVLRKPAWIAALSGLGAALVIALGVYGMPLKLALSSTAMGAAFGLFPIGWIVYWAIVLYRLTLETGNFEIIKDSVGGLTSDRRLQALLIAFALGAFIEGAAGFGTPVAVAAAMLTGLGFSPFFAAGICLLANTAPVAFGSIGIPIITLGGITAPLHGGDIGAWTAELSAWVGRLCAPISVIIPSYLILVMGGFGALRNVLPASVLCGLAFASVQFLMSNFVGPELVDIVASLVAILALVVLLKVWQPTNHFVMPGEHDTSIELKSHGFGRTLLAWSPYLFLVFFVLVWGSPWGKAVLNGDLVAGSWRGARLEWPGLHNLVVRAEPIVPTPTPYAAPFDFNWLSAAGTACAFASLAAAVVLRVSVRRYVVLLGSVAKQLAFPLVTIAAVVGLAYLMNYSGATITLGLVFAGTGALFPFFSAILGWLGVFLTGSDTSSNALFGNLQVVTAARLGLDPAIMAAANSAGGVMGKMISLQSIAVAVAATGMSRSQEGELFRFTFKHCVLLAAAIGVLTTIYAYLV